MPDQKMQKSNSIAESFGQLDFHDDTLMDIRILPAKCRGEGTVSVVEIKLLQYSENKQQIIRFSGCTNLRVAMDFDILADSLPPNMSSLEAHTDLNRIRNLIESQKKDWDVEYAKTATSPLVKKLEAISDLVFFRVQFFGGVVDIIAREYQIQATNKTL